MKKRILRYLKHIFGTIIILLTIGIIILLSENGAVHYGDNPLRLDMDKEGPYVFYNNDSILQTNYLRGNKTEGFYLEQESFKRDTTIRVSCFFRLDSTEFSFNLKPKFEIPKTTYNDGQPILAISDIESGYRTFRDFLMNANVIDANLNWTFGKGHLVLVGDFVDRGFSTTQVLWFIYKLEQDAKKKGGFVHYILGNHELKNMQGMYGAASPKYHAVASILGKQQHQLYNSNSFIGKWMASKNTIELINGNLFTHGGLHPEIADYRITLDEINHINRNNYYKIFHPKPKKTIDQLILSTHQGVSWYRGYFKDDLSQEEVEKGLNKFGANAIVVGHTIQSKVNKQYEGKVIGIDVQHPNDYHKNWPNKKSEGLLIENGIYYRVLANGDRKEL